MRMVLVVYRGKEMMQGRNLRQLRRMQTELS